MVCATENRILLGVKDIYSGPFGQHLHYPGPYPVPFVTLRAHELACTSG